MDGEKGRKASSPVHAGHCGGGGAHLEDVVFHEVGQHGDSKHRLSSEFACGWTSPIPANIESLQDPWLLDKANPTRLGQCAINRSDMSLPDQST